MMQFNALQAYLEGDKVVVLQPDLEPELYKLQPGGEMIPNTEPDPELKRKALAWSLWGPLMIRLKAYHE